MTGFYGFKTIKSILKLPAVHLCFLKFRLIGSLQMVLIFAAALCSVLVSVLLKNLKKKGYQPMQMIAWNYASASLLCYLWFKPDIQHISIQHTPWWLIMALGVILPSIFCVLLNL